MGSKFSPATLESLVQMTRSQDRLDVKNQQTQINSIVFEKRRTTAAETNTHTTPPPLFSLNEFMVQFAPNERRKSSGVPKVFLRPAQQKNDCMASVDVEPSKVESATGTLRTSMLRVRRRSEGLMPGLRMNTSAEEVQEEEEEMKRLMETSLLSVPMGCQEEQEAEAMSTAAAKAAVGA